MTSPPPSTSTHIPAGPAPAGPQGPIPACARHALVDGPKHCRACKASLCTACVRHPIHALCPSCARAQNLPVWRITWGWLWTLWWDAVVTAAPRLHKSALPLVVLLWAALRTGAVTPEVRMTSQSLSYIADAVLLSLLVGTIATPLRMVPPTLRRVWRALLIQVLTILAIVVPSAVLWWLLSSVWEAEHAWVFWVLGSALVWLLLPVMQACAALQDGPLWRVARVPFSAGLKALFMCALPGTVLSFFNMAGHVFAQGESLPAAMMGALTSSFYLFVQAALAVMAYRFLWDARAARETT